ncbi:DUF1735 domain-containing protein [Alistipes sp.]|uniref:DUF1735 domain-containing protein n=1 Tax=Alistipes sp. TaxID=1872444 RepID=UPI0025C5499B|nr:DUF1735 domain-containing protein [Alistipes sp.]
MKINIWKLLLVAMALPAVMGSCKDDRNNYMVDDSISFVDSDGSWEATDDKARGYISVPVYTSYTFPVVKNGKGLSGTTVRIEASESALVAFNEANGTDFALLPETCYTFETKQLNFSKDDIRKYVTISWNMDGVFELDPATNYVVPIQLVSTASDVPVSEDRSLMLLHPEVSRVSMQLLETGTTTVENGTFVYNGNVTLSSPVPVSDITIEYAIDDDPALVEAYNKANGTSYEVVPTGFASMVDDSAVIKANETEVPFACQLNLDKLLASVDKMETGILIPVRISSVSKGAFVAEGSDIVYFPIVNSPISGSKESPWQILEGEELAWVNDPNRDPKPSYIDSYLASNLFNGASIGGDSFIPWWNTPITYPLAFVADMGAAHLFSKFIITDTTDNQGSYRDYEIYIAEEYKGEDTEWTLIASGLRDWNGEQATGVEQPYDYPVQKIAVGRYLKFVIVKCEEGSQNPNKGKLGDVAGVGL